MSSEFMGGGAASFPFDRIGDSVTGVIIAPPEKRVQTKTDGSGEAKTFKDGSVRYMWYVRLQTNLRDPADPFDTGERSVFLKWKSQDAVRIAVRAAGGQDLLPGGTLTLAFTGEEPAQQRGQNPTKLWQARYVPPPSGLMAESTQQPQASQYGQQPLQPGQYAQPPQYVPPPQYAPPQQYVQPAPQYAAPPQPAQQQYVQPNWPQQPPTYHQPAPAVPALPATVNHRGEPQSPFPPDFGAVPISSSPVSSTPVSPPQPAPLAEILEQDRRTILERLRDQQAAGLAHLPQPPAATREQAGF